VVDKVESKDLEQIATRNLSSLLIITNDVLKNLKRKYPSYRFNLSVEVRIDSIDYASIFRLKDEFRENRVSQILDFIKNLKVRANLYSDVTVLKYNFVKREDRH